MHGTPIWSAGTSPPLPPTSCRVVDLTFVATWAGVAYVCFITDAFSSDRGLAGRLKCGMRWSSTPRDGPLVTGNHVAGLTMSLRRGVAIHLCKVRRAARRDRRGALRQGGSGTATTTPWPRRSTVSTRPNWSTGRPAAAWKTVEDLELATLGWVHWHNTNRLHGYLGDLPPAEYEAIFYATNRTDQATVEIQ